MLRPPSESTESLDEAQLACRLCGNGPTRLLGRIPKSDFFAGRVLPLPLPGSNLYECQACQSKFRHPILPEEDYRVLYEQGEASHWEGMKDRLDLQTVVRLLGQKGGPYRVLDVGCGTGELLAALPSQVAKFGVEPSLASVQAEARGISLLGGSLEWVPGGTQFDAITIIDVIEHLAHPSELLDRAFALLSPGGLLIVSTGDPRAKAWRRSLGHRFWYTSFPEHLSFPSQRFFEDWTRGRAASIEIHPIRYQRLNPAVRLVRLGIQVAFMVSPGLFSALGRVAERLRGVPHPRRQYFSPGVPGLFLDHQVVVIRKYTTGYPVLGKVQAQTRQGTNDPGPEP